MAWPRDSGADVVDTQAGSWRRASRTVAPPEPFTISSGRAVPARRTGWPADVCGQKPEQAHRHVIAPVEILDNDDQGVIGREQPKQMRHGLEDAGSLFDATRRRARALRDLGKEPRQVEAGDRSELPEELLAQNRSKRFDPRGKRQDILALTATTEEEFVGAALSARREFAHEAALADSGLRRQ